MYGCVPYNAPVHPQQLERNEGYVMTIFLTPAVLR